MTSLDAIFVAIIAVVFTGIVAGVISGMRTANNRIDRMDPEDISAPRPKQVAMRLRFAMRYGAEQQDDGQIVRADVVRKAFNSPFHPFVLASTSVGQEGLDFHRYCHAVVHWNLPSNPVDMEQREGRIHRYKGHAVRKNLALRYGAELTREGADPWRGIIAAALRDRNNAQSDITPFWVYANEGGSRIERYVPALPLSRDAQVYADLRQSLAAYRMVFGQSRQQELLQLLASRVSPEQLAEVSDALRVNLEPDAAGAQILIDP